MGGRISRGFPPKGGGISAINVRQSCGLCGVRVDPCLGGAAFATFDRGGGDTVDAPLVEGRAEGRPEASGVCMQRVTVGEVEVHE